MAVTIIRKPLVIDDEKNRAKTLEKTQLRFDGRFRWNILITFIIVAFIVFPFFVPITVLFALNFYFIFFWLVFTVANIVRNVKIGRTLKEAKKEEAEAVLNTVSSKVDARYKYIMVTFAYKEPIEMISNCLNNVSSLNNHQDCIVGVCLEERTPELEDKIEFLKKNYGDVFSELIITVHPFGMEGEIPGKCSNANYGIRSVYSFLKDKYQNLNPEDYFLVGFDIDTVFHKHFLNILDKTLKADKDPHRVVWQPLLYYNWKLDELSFFTRVIGILRSTMMGAALVTLNINVMSVYCASLRLYIDGNFTHPFYQMEDIICYIRWMIVSKKRLSIKPIYSPTLSGPTSGENMVEELKELWIQGTRWTIGSAEVFHYFMCKLRRLNFFDALIWGLNYLNYYVGILCVQNLLSIVTTIKLLVFPSEEGKVEEILRLGFLVLPVLIYVLYGMMIVVNKIAVKKYLVELGVKEDIGFFRDIFHWILSVPTGIFYSFIVVYGFLSILINGKAVCKHRASDKENLV